MKKRFIEFDLPLEDISRSSSREKAIRHGYPSTLHIWWARKPLASSRTTNFAALIDMPENDDEKRKIYNLIKDITPWESVTNSNNKQLEIAKNLLNKQWQSAPPKVIDPFAGGGSIPLEALRLGCETYASDYNPVAVLIEKATIEWPQKFGLKIPSPDKNQGIDGHKPDINLLSYLVKKWSVFLFNEAKKDIEPFFPNDPDGSIPIGYLWSHSIKCQNPDCPSDIPLTSHYWLCKKKNLKIAYKPVIAQNKIRGYLICENDEIDFDPSEGTVARGNVVCPVCRQVTGVKKLRELAQKGDMKEHLMVVVLNHPEKIGKKYRIAEERDKLIIKNANEKLLKEIESWAWLDRPIPNENLPEIGTLGFRVQRYGIAKWGQLFNDRQKLVLITFIKHMRSLYGKIKYDISNLKIKDCGIDEEELSRVVLGYLGLGLDRLVDFGSKLCLLNPTGGRGVVHTFGRQALPMIWDYAESNPLNPFGAGWPTAISKNLDWIKNGEKISRKPAKVFLSSATSIPYPNNFFDAVFTDPPYYDNVPYADLSDFFYVWLKRSIGDLFPNLLATPLTVKTDEIVAEPVRRDNAKLYFENMLYLSFKEMYRVLKIEGIATIVYAHKTTIGWETMLNALIRAGFVITASWSIHTEMKGRLRAVSSAALASSIYMICRKKERKEVGFYSEIQPQIRRRIEQKLQQFWNEDIVGGDFFISAIGPGMEIFSQYERVEKLSGEQVTTGELLDFIRSVSTDYIVNKLLHDLTSAQIDNPSEFYLAFRWTYEDNTVDYDDARKLASASGFSLEDHWGPDGFVKKQGSNISILGPKERGEIKHVDNMVDVMHRCLLLWERGERDEITRLLAETGFKDDPAFKQFCQAVAESLLNGNKEKQLLEGFLIGIDSYTKAKVKKHKDQTGLEQFGGK